jgi:hypothetical protein
MRVGKTFQKGVSVCGFRSGDILAI